MLLVFTETEEVGKLRAEVEERNRQLQQIVNGLVSENIALKSGMEELKRKVEADFGELKKSLKALEELTA